MNLPYIINGTITDTDATNPNGAKVVIRNDTNGETISVLTNSSGQYVGDVANLTSGYTQTDRITVTCAFGNASNEDSFLISDDTHTVNLTLATVAESSDVTYAQIVDVLEELGDKTTDDISYSRVRKAILRAESEIEQRSNTKFKSTTFTDKEYDFNQYTTYKSPEQLIGRNTSILTGNRNDYQNSFFNDKLKLGIRPILTITSLETNSASLNGTDNWTTLTEQTGSGGDFIIGLTEGEITFLNNVPALGKRKVRISGTYGYSTVPGVVERLTILLAIKSILTSKSSGSQFDSTDGVSLEGISITKGIGGSVSYLSDIRKEIMDLWKSIDILVSQTV